MPYDSNGNYTLPPVYKAVAGTEITTPQHNNPLEDIQAALNDTVLRNGSAPITQNWNMGSNRIIFLADGIADTDAANVGQMNVAISQSASEIKEDAEKTYAKTEDTLQLTSATSQTVASAVVFSGEVSVPNPPDIPGVSAGNHAASTSWTDANYAKLNGSNTLRGQQIFSGNVITNASGYFESYDQSGGQASGAFGAYDPGTGDAGVEVFFNITNSARSHIQQFRATGEGRLTSSTRGEFAVISQLPFSDLSLKIQVFQVYYSGGKQVVNLPTAFSRLLFVSPAPVDSAAPVQCSAVDNSGAYSSGASFTLNAWWAGGNSGFNWSWHGNIYILAVGQY